MYPLHLNYTTTLWVGGGGAKSTGPDRHLDPDKQTDMPEWVLTPPGENVM